MSEIKQILKELTEADGLGGLTDALDVAESYLSQYASVRRSGLSLIGEIKGDSDYTVLLDAHIDQIGMVVTSVKEGFVRVAAAGGIDRRMLAGMKVTIHASKTIRGVFCSVPPHLGKTDEVAKINEMYIDTGLSQRAEEIISVGDRVTFEQSFSELIGDRVTAKSLDNRAGCAALIRCAELISKKKPPCNVVFLLSDLEELGGRGAAVESYSIYPDEAVAVDVSFGTALDVPASESGTLGKGAMLGISPVLSKNVTDRLKAAAESSKAPFQLEVMGGRTSTNADKITYTRGGVPTGLLSIPLRNMHTPVEVADIKDIESVAVILAEYVNNCKRSQREKSR